MPKGKQQKDGLSSKEKAQQEVNKARQAKQDLAEAHWQKIRDHVMLGEVQGKGNKASIVGMHSHLCIGHHDCNLRWSGEVIATLPNGCYTRGVTTGDGKVTKVSTFFPVNWTENDIKAVVVSAHQTQVQGTGRGSNAKVNDMPILFMGGNTAFPNYT